MSRRHFAFDLFGDGEPVAEPIRESQIQDIARYTGWPITSRALVP